jgi:catechol 2,3-dioxygenase-like lactoylglutathione lyase family enzyme
VTIVRLDHLVLTVKDLDATIKFYTEVLGIEAVTFGDGSKALAFGDQKINLHERGREPEPKAQSPMPGSADICLVSDSSVDEFIEHLRSVGTRVVEGPVERTGALGPMTSVYVRDPDGNLVEVSEYRSG